MKDLEGQARSMDIILSVIGSHWRVLRLVNDIT